MASDAEDLKIISQYFKYLGNCRYRRLDTVYISADFYARSARMSPSNCSTSLILKLMFVTVSGRILKKQLNLIC